MSGTQICLILIGTFWKHYFIPGMVNRIHIVCHLLLIVVDFWRSVLRRILKPWLGTVWAVTVAASEVCHRHGWRLEKLLLVLITLILTQERISWVESLVMFIYEGEWFLCLWVNQLCKEIFLVISFVCVSVCAAIVVLLFFRQYFREI